MEGIDKSVLKFSLSLLLHGLCYVITLYFLGFFRMEIGYGENYLLTYAGVTAFSIIYFVVLWRKLYSKEYHFYLSQSPTLITKYLPVLLGIFLVAEFSITYLYSSSKALPSHIFIHIFIKYLLFMFSQYLFFKVQYSWIIYLAKLGFFRKNTMFVGNFDKRMYLENLFQDIKWTKNYIGHLSIDEGEWMYQSYSNSERKFGIGNIDQFLHEKQVNELIICFDKSLSHEAVDELISHCHKNSIGYYFVPEMNSSSLIDSWSNQFTDIPVIKRYCPNRDSLLMISFKRMFDIVVSFLALVFLSPVLLAISIAIALVDGFPVIYTSKRVGIHGQSIRFHKFRTMVKNAESLKQDLMDLNERPDGPLFKLADDPRVTSIGRILRKYSLDELPQFWNVLRGDMSLIGPRPHLPEEVLEYDPIDYLRLECVPGISCLPQIRGRDNLGFREWVDLDLEYRKNWSFRYDLWIMWETVKVVLSPLFRKKDKKYDIHIEDSSEKEINREIRVRSI